METAEALAFCRDHHSAVLTTLREDGTPQMSPVTVGVSGGEVVISSRETAVKTRHLLRDPRAFLCVFTDRFYGPWVYVNGTAEVVHLPEAMGGLVEYYRDISGEHPDWEDYRAAMERDRRVLLRITPASVGPTFHG